MCWEYPTWARLHTALDDVKVWFSTKKHFFAGFFENTFFNTLEKVYTLNTGDFFSSS